MRPALKAIITIILLVSMGFSAQAKTTVKFWALFGGDSGKIIEDICKRFEKANPDIKVEYSNIGGGDDYVNKVVTAVSGGVGPDLVWSAPDRFDSLYRKMVVPVSELQKVGGKVNLDDFYKGLVNPKYHYDGILGGLPFENGNLALYYNKVLFAQAGIGTPPKTWEQLGQIAQKLTFRDKRQYGLLTNYWDWYIPMLYEQKGVTMIDGNKVNFNSKEGIEAVKWYSELSTKYKVVSDTGFENGKTAMAIDGSWRYQSYKQFKKLDFALSQLPYADGGKPTSLISYKELIVLRGNGNPRIKAAYKLERFILEEQNFVPWCISTSYLPVTKVQAASPAFRKYLEANPDLQVALDQSETGFVQRPYRGNRNIMASLQSALNSIISGKKSVQQALDDATKAGQAFLNH